MLAMLILPFAFSFFFNQSTDSKNIPQAQVDWGPQDDGDHAPGLHRGMRADSQLVL
jgi:hypothetical protein